MSRLAFDDILKSSTSLGPSASRVDPKNRSASAAAEESSLFDDTFKQAVEELRPNEKPNSDEEFNATAQNREQTIDSPEKEEKKKAASASKEIHRTEKQSTESDDEQPLSATKPSSESDESTDPDDALVAMVVAAAVEQEKTLSTDSEAETTDQDAVEEASEVPGLPEDNPTGETTPAIDTDFAEQLTNAEQNVAAEETYKEVTEASNSPEKGDTEQKVLPGETSNQPESVESLIASNEVVVPQETATTSEAAQATVATTAEMGTTEAETANMGTADETTTQEASTVAGTTQANAGQQDDMDQDSNHEEGDAESEMAALGQSQTSTSNAASGQSEDEAIQVTDTKQKTSETSVKVEAPTDRPAAATNDTRVGHDTSNNTTHQTTDSTLDTTDRVRFVERVAQAFNAQSAENRAIRMRLHPEELGEIKLEMTVRNGTMHAKIETETREARNLLLDNLPALRERLASHNIKVEQFDIDYNAGGDQQGAPQNPGDWSDSNQNGSDRSSHSGTGTAEEADTRNESAPRPVSRAGSGKQIDVTG